MNALVRSAAVAAVCLVPGAVGAEVVLLANGSLLEGEVRRTADEVAVERDGGLLQLRPAEVLHVGDSPLAVYEWLRGRTKPDARDATEHLAIAEWAISNRLWPQAARELLDARQLEPGSRRLALLERRLDELSRPAPPRPRAPEPAVQQAAHFAAVEPAAEEPLPTLPEGAIEHFTRRVQPLLLNGCAAAGCHRGQTPDDRFPLDPSWLHGYATARSTRHNLRTALAAIDLASPDQSPLLTAARGPHAGVTPLAGSRREELIGRLAAWVQSVAAVNAPATDVAKASPEPETPTEDAVAQAAAGESANAATGVEQSLFEAPSPPQRGVRLERMGPRDEFDPAIFNERYRRPQDDEPVSP